MSTKLGVWQAHRSKMKKVSTNIISFLLHQLFQNNQNSNKKVQAKVVEPFRKEADLECEVRV